MKLNNSMSDMYYINENFIEFFTEVTIFFYWFLLKRIYNLLIVKQKIVVAVLFV